ncbi:MAG: methylenetetrahydrofolate reductase, partial [Pseudomonadota bacterium]
MESQKKYPRTFSFEFFPPKTPQGMEKLRASWKQLMQLKPKFFSVTYGAGGSTRERTLQAVLEIQKDGCDAAPHISCIGSSRADIKATLELYRVHGLRHIVALRGDLPSGTASAGELRYANELVEFIRQTTGDHFHIEVACYPEFHPQARSAQDDLKAFKRKVDAGANAAITQYFYNADAYFRFIDECEVMGIALPIVPGIMPIANFS